MPVLTIQDFPDQLWDRISARAEGQGRSLAEEVVVLLRRAIDEENPYDSIRETGTAYDAAYSTSAADSSWSPQDQADFTAASLRYASEIYSDEEDLI